MNIESNLVGALAVVALFAAGCDAKDGGDDASDDAGSVVAEHDTDTDDDDDPTGGEEPSTTTSTPEPEPEAEACDAEAAARACAGEGYEGTQYCAPIGPDETLQWGQCIEFPECEPGEFVHCGFCPGDDADPSECPDFGSTCYLAGDAPTLGEQDDCNTPLVLSFDGAPVSLSATPAAAFDINATGACVSTDWPAATTPWLVLDLDRSGTIDSGRELFGSGTRLPSGRRATNGFAALEVLDDNHDGRIDASDTRFSELALWADEDADKAATLAELTPVGMRGILSIDLGYRVDPRCDDRGNCEMQRAGFTYIDRGGEVRDGEVVDLYLSCQ